jgi:hypothetical protein
MAASAKSILFGDFSYYVIRDAMDVRCSASRTAPTPSSARSASSPGCATGGNLIDVGGAVKLFVNATHGTGTPIAATAILGHPLSGPVA